MIHEENPAYDESAKEQQNQEIRKLYKVLNYSMPMSFILAEELALNGNERNRQNLRSAQFTLYKLSKINRIRVDKANNTVESFIAGDGYNANLPIKHLALWLYAQRYIKLDKLQSVRLCDELPVVLDFHIVRNEGTEKEDFVAYQVLYAEPGIEMDAVLCARRYLSNTRSIVITETLKQYDAYKQIMPEGSFIAYFTGDPISAKDKRPYFQFVKIGTEE